MWLMYLVISLDGFLESLGGAQDFLVPVIVILAIGLTASFIPASIMKNDKYDGEGWQNYLDNVFPKLLKIFKILVAMEIIIFLLLVVVPTTKQAAAIYFVPKVINNKQIRKMPDKLVTLANSWMDEQIKSIKSK
jgi:hypothetical protein